MTFEIRNDADGALDEVIAHNAFVHLERMDTNAWWLGITLPDGRCIHVNLATKRSAILARAEEM
jgi:hypothetical protein